MNQTSLSERVNAISFWYHKIELPGGLITPGRAPWNAASYQVPEDLSGKRVLDIGAWDGYWSFEALRRGADQVVAIDDFSDFIGENIERREWDSFDLCRDALGYSETQCQRHQMSLYDLKPDRFGTFDVVFFFGTIYHLRHPLLALDLIADVCRELLIVESAILDDYSPYYDGIGSGYPGQQMLMEFYPGDELGHNHTNWWAPTLECLSHMVRSSGFNVADSWKLVDTPKTLSHCRGFVKAHRAAS